MTLPLAALLLLAQAPEASPGREITPPNEPSCRDRSPECEAEWVALFRSWRELDPEPPCPEGKPDCDPWERYAIIVPACPNGQAYGCEPWERDWSTARPSETDYLQFATGTDGAIWSVQNLSMVNNRGSRTPRVWVQVDYSAVRSEPARRGLYVLRVDCDGGRIATVNSTRYGPTGDVLSSQDIPDFAAQYENVVPGTMFSAVRNAVCPR